MTTYIYKLFVIAPNGVSQAISEMVCSSIFPRTGLCVDAGPNNVNIGLVPINGEDDAEITHYGFSAPVTQAHIDVLFGAGIGSNPMIKWARTDRDGNLQKRWDNETPESIKYDMDDLLIEAGLKYYKNVIMI